MDKQAVSPVVGFILLVQILIIFLTLVQTVFIPDQLKKIEADNVEKLRGEAEKLSAFMLSGDRAYMLVSLPEYPEYLFLMTPEPAGASIYSETFNVTLNYTEILPNGTKVSVSKDFKNSRIFIALKNYYYPDVTFVFENGVVFQKQGNSVIALGEQNLIDNGVNLVIVKCNVSTAFNVPKEISFEPVSTGGFVYGENISITFESVNPKFWEKFGEVSGNVVTINVSSGIIRTNVYALEGSSVDRKPYRMLKLNPFNSYTISTGETKEFGVAILDRFNNPVVGEKVNISVGGGIGTVDGLTKITKVTDSAGRVYVSFRATTSGEGNVIFQADGMSVSYSIKVTAPRVISGISLINVEWLNKSSLDSGYGNVWDAYIENTKTLEVKVYDQDLQLIPNIDVRFAVTNSSVVDLSSTISTTNSNGIASVQAFPLSNGSTKIYAFAGDAGDVLNLTISNVTRPPWVYEGWRYRIPIYIEERSGSTLYDYQVLVTLTSTNFNWSHINTDCSDVRFTTETGRKLKYWIESCDYASKIARIWVKVPEIPANQNITIYMYYGNSTAVSESNGSATFIFFDDFDNWSGWSPVGDGNVVQYSYGGDLVLMKTVYCDPNGGYKLINENIQNFRIIVKERRDSEGWDCRYNRYGIENTNWDGYGIYRQGYTSSSGVFGWEVRDNGASVFKDYRSLNQPMENWYITELKKYGNYMEAVLYDSNGVKIGSESGIIQQQYLFSDLDRIVIRGGRPYYVAWIAVAEFVSPEPAVIFGQEEIY